MPRHILGVVVSSVMLLSSAAVAAQGSRVIITVTQSNRNTPAAGAAVCFSSTTNTKLADANGTVTFDNTPSGQWSAVAWKSGFRARRADISVSGTAAATASIALTQPGTEASPCVLPHLEGTTSTALPPDPVADLDLDVAQSSNPVIGGTRQTYTVKAYNRGNKSASAILVRSSISTNLDYLASESTADKGFSCSRSGTTVNCSSGALGIGDSATIKIVTWLSSGASSGNAIAFNANADPDNAIPESNESNNTVNAATTSQAGPARLGEQILTARGRFDVDPTLTTQLDCKKFGNSYVMVGIKGYAGQAVDRISLLCETMEPGGKISSPAVPTSQFTNEPSTGIPFTRQCPQGSVVAGIAGTLNINDTKQFDGFTKSLTLACARIGALGLTTVSATGIESVGVPTTRTFGPDSCGGTRPARALKVAAEMGGFGFGDLVASYVIFGVQLICEQPVVP